MGLCFVVIWLTLYGLETGVIFRIPNLVTEYGLDESLAFVGMQHMRYLPIYLKVFYDVVLWGKNVVVANYGGDMGYIES